MLQGRFCCSLHGTTSFTELDVATLYQKQDRGWLQDEARWCSLFSMFLLELKHGCITSSPATRCCSHSLGMQLRRGRWSKVSLDNGAVPGPSLILLMARLRVRHPGSVRKPPGFFAYISQTSNRLFKFQHCRVLQRHRLVRRRPFSGLPPSC